MDRNMRRVLSIFFAIYMSLYVLGLIHFGVFLQLKLAPYFREHSTELEAGTAELLFGFLYIAALYLTLWLPSILKPACPRSLIEKLYSYKHTEYIAMTVGCVMCVLGTPIFFFTCMTAAFGVVWKKRLEVAGEDFLASKCSGLTWMTVALLASLASFLIALPFFCSKDRSDSESQRRRMVGLVSEDLRLEDIEAQRRARMSRVRF